ncbi:hypothetical protein FNV43_RR02098 [Rhamnella rubrinervis]|uniref:Uncharacterized protein n=1 Tax=Rhamnella rubrinervis TaxID=2594499 RepID=A0A8K0HT82_9ROSA|nr:hypothetical protein FNV43_RR02098 [Rhamnella rubrinervis]
MESASELVPFPLLITPIESNYRACTIPYRFSSDNPRKPTPTEIAWIDLFLNSIPSFKKRAETDATVPDATVPDAPIKAEKFAQRVCEFTKLTPVKLLEETEKVVGDPQLPIQHRALVEKSKELKNMEQAESMRKKLPWLKYDMKKAEYMEAKEQENDAKKKLDEAAKTLNDLKEPIERQKQEKARLDGKSKNIKTEPYVLFGGSGASIIKQTSKTGEGNEKAADGPSVAPQGIYHGHEDTVEDVTFCPSSSQEFCSVGDDSCLILWDARVGTNPVVKVEKAHDADLHCVDWSPYDDNLILTGSADNSVRMFDRRNLTSDGVGAPIHKFEGHKAAVLCVQVSTALHVLSHFMYFLGSMPVAGIACIYYLFYFIQWSPDKSSVFGSAAEDGLLNIWDYDRVGKKVERARRTPAPPGLFFQHAGHRDKVVDFHWNASDPWTVSVSDDCDTTCGRGTLQIWRMSDLIYRPEEGVLGELEKFISHVVACASSKP